MTYCRYHCRTCGAHFTSLEGFDAHRADFECSWPDLPARSEWIEKLGVCKIAAAESAVGVTYVLVRPAKYGAGSDVEGRESAEGSAREAVVA
jgi:hypothetical protein